MKLKDATAGQHVWLADGTECIVGRDHMADLRLVWRCNVNADDWFHLDTEFSTEPPSKPKPPRTLTDLRCGTLIYIKEQHNLYSCACNTTVENTYILGNHGDGRYDESPNLIEGRDFTVYGPAEIAADGTITIRPAKTVGDK